MINEQKLIVTEKGNSQESGFLDDPILDGFHIGKYRAYLSSILPQNGVDRIISNAFESIHYFRDPNLEGAQIAPSKILCLGKVQSGKTSFFLASVALAFDNGYDAAFILGGTKLKLKEQNLDRVCASFENNEKIKIINVDGASTANALNLIEAGYKVIFVVLKNPAKNTNLGKMAELAEEFKNVPSVIVDDEGDEFTPGAPNAKRKNTKAGRTHDKISGIIGIFRICSFLSVTATPQANLLVSTFDEISPNRLVLVRPGIGYTGGRAFFDTADNPHVRVINDNDDFIDSMPDSFKEAFYFFLFSCCLKRAGGDKKTFSMLVHPSSFNAVQEVVARRINNFFETTIKPAAEEPKSIYYHDLVSVLGSFFTEYEREHRLLGIKSEDVVGCLPDVINGLTIQIINSSNPPKNLDDDSGAYVVKVGGNMLGRGLTIDRLIVSYIYRDSKVAQVDTMYQRCRWFGYKSSYFDICKVYMTADLQTKFMVIVQNEDHMWNSMEAFLDAEIDLTKFKRVFLLNDERLILTRKSVSNTVGLSVSSSGNKADECIELKPEQRERNRDLYFEYCEKHFHEGSLIDFDDSPGHNQRHLVLKTRYTDFYREFLSKLTFAFGSPFGNGLFMDIYNKTMNGLRSDEITVLFMRYGKGESRSPTNGTMTSITRLFQGRNDGTHFSGDRYPVDLNGNDYSRMAFIEVHMVDVCDKMPVPQNSIPLLSFNDPLTAETIRMVTGSNYYGS